MGHTSGLPGNLCAGLFCDPDLSEDDSLELIAKMQLARPPWSSLPVYPNVGFAVLAHAWEKATSPPKTCSQFLRDELWAPLGMRDTRVPGDLVDGVELAPGDLYPNPADYSIGWQGPDGDMFYSTTPDLAKFLKFLLYPNLTGLLLDAAIRETTHLTTVFTSTTGLTGFALPWELIRTPLSGTNRSTTLITKDGGLGSYRCIIAFHPDSQLGVAVLASVNDTSRSTYRLLAITTMQDLIPAVQSVHSSFISSLYSGVYMCKHTGPVVSAQLKNTTLEVLGGSISVATMTPHQNLVAVYNVSIVQNGFQGLIDVSWSLMAKPGRDRHSFWSAPDRASPWRHCWELSRTLPGPISQSPWTCMSFSLSLRRSCCYGQPGVACATKPEPSVVHVGGCTSGELSALFKRFVRLAVMRVGFAFSYTA